MSNPTENRNTFVIRFAHRRNAAEMAGVGRCEHEDEGEGGDESDVGSGSGFETSEFTKPTKEEVLKYGTDGLAFYRVENGKTQPMQVKVALQGQFKKLLYATHPDGNKIMTLDRLNEAIKDENWLLYVFLYRVLTLWSI